jgi:hypothetical protein
VLGIESHSWDHNHPSISKSAQRNNEAILVGRDG